jgi:hypothetical protein
MLKACGDGAGRSYRGPETIRAGLRAAILNSPGEPEDEMEPRNREIRSGGGTRERSRVHRPGGSRMFPGKKKPETSVFRLRYFTPKTVVRPRSSSPGLSFLVSSRLNLARRPGALTPASKRTWRPGTTAGAHRAALWFHEAAAPGTDPPTAPSSTPAVRGSIGFVCFSSFTNYPCGRARRGVPHGCRDWRHPGSSERRSERRSVPPPRGRKQ